MPLPPLPVWCIGLESRGTAACDLVRAWASAVSDEQRPTRHDHHGDRSKYLHLQECTADSGYAATASLYRLLLSPFLSIPLEQLSIHGGMRRLLTATTVLPEVTPPLHCSPARFVLCTLLPPLCFSSSAVVPSWQARAESFRQLWQRKPRWHWAALTSAACRWSVWGARLCFIDNE